MGALLRDDQADVLGPVASTPTARRLPAGIGPAAPAGLRSAKAAARDVARLRAAGTRTGRTPAVGFRPGQLARVRWGVAGRIAVSWALTLPAAAAVGGVAAWVADRGNLGVALVGLVTLVAAAGFYALSRRTPVNRENVNGLPDLDEEAADRSDA
jgi:PiT family inorganic phosphate transporter